MTSKFCISTILVFCSIMVVLACPTIQVRAGSVCGNLQEQEEDPFAEPEQEEEDPFAEPDDPKEPVDPQEEEDPFAEPNKPKKPVEPQEQEDPFAEPNKPKKPVEPQEQEDPFAEPNKPKKPVEPQEEDPFAEPDPKPSDPMPTDPKPTDPKPAPKADQPKSDQPKSAEPKKATDVGDSSPVPAESSNKVVSPKKDVGSTTKNEVMATGSDINPLGSSTKPITPPGSGLITGGSDLKTNDPTGEFSPEVDTAFEKFKNIIREIRTNEQTINQLVISMPVGFPEKREQQQNQVKNLRQRNKAIADQLLPAARESFEKFPNTQPEVTAFLLQRIQRMLTGKNYRRTPFDPLAAEEACNRMIESGVESPILYLFGYRTNYLINNFPAAGRRLQKAAMMGHQVDPRLFEDLKFMHTKFEKEKEMRALDAANGCPQVRIEMDCGTMLVELFEDQAPNTVANFMTLVQDGFYNGLIFYQVQPTEIAVTGSPSNDGQGGPGYQIKSEAELETARSHFTGTLSMMSTGENSSGSIFLITKQPRIQFDGKITAFGRVIEGLQNLYKIKVVNRTAALSKNDQTEPTKIIRMSVVRKRDHEYVPEKITPSRAGG